MYAMSLGSLGSLGVAPAAAPQSLDPLGMGQHVRSDQLQLRRAELDGGTGVGVVRHCREQGEPGRAFCLDHLLKVITMTQSALMRVATLWHNRSIVPRRLL